MGSIRGQGDGLCMGEGAGLRECGDWHCRVLKYPCSNGARGGTGRASSFWQAEKGCDMTRFIFYIILNFFSKFWSSLLHEGFLKLQQVGVPLYLRCLGFSLPWFLLLHSMDSRLADCSNCSIVLVGSACGIFPNQGLNQCSLHWQADS